MAARRTIHALVTLTLAGLAGTAYGQNIFSIAGVPYGHRPAVDGRPALNAPLDFVYGLLFDRVTGRLLFHDQTLVERIESDSSLLALIGRTSARNFGPNPARCFRPRWIWALIATDCRAPILPPPPPTPGLFESSKVEGARLGDGAIDRSTGGRLSSEATDDIDSTQRRFSPKSYQWSPTQLRRRVGTSGTTPTS